VHARVLGLFGSLSLPAIVIFSTVAPGAALESDSHHSDKYASAYGDDMECTLHVHVWRYLFPVASVFASDHKAVGGLPSLYLRSHLRVQIMSKDGS
jgi:hypothetical protein